MTIFVKVKTGAKIEAVKKVDENHYEVMTKEAPEKGRANAAVIKLLADYFNVSSWQVSISAGHTSKAKIVKIKNQNEK